MSIINFIVKSHALKLASTILTITHSSSKAFYFVKYCFGSRLAPLHPEWHCLHDNATPSAQFLSPFYEVCLKVVNSLIGILSRQDWFDFDFSTKQCYKVLLRQNSSPPILHRFWSSFLNPGFNLDRHWSFVRDQFSENYKNDLVWLIVLRVVKVRYSLKHWGYIDNDKCAICSRVETIDHCFLNCARAKMVWAHFRSALSLLIGSPFVRNCVSVFFFQWPIIDAKNARLARYLIKTILYVIWTFRNKSTFHNGNETSRAIIKYILSDVRKRIV